MQLNPNTPEASMTSKPQNIVSKIRSFTERFVIFSDEAHADILALWILHTHAMDAAYATPYLYVHSAEPQSGKTRVTEVAQLLTRNSQKADNLTTSALFRRMADSEPTLFIDEVDTIFSGSANEELRGVLNSGYKQGGVVSRFTGKEVEDFPTYCPKMLAGIDNGAMPDTLRDRCIGLNLKRKRTDQEVERFVPRKVEPQAEELRNEIREWAQANYDKIMDAPDPEYIDGISDRAFEVSEPLLVLAQIAGGKAYVKQVRAHLLHLLGKQTPKLSEGVRALTIAREMFEDYDANRVSSADLAAKVGTTPALLGRILGKYDVSPTTIKFQGGKVAKGYHKHAFTDAWERYL